MSTTTRAELDYFATPGPLTALSDYAERVDALPADPVALAHVVRGLLLHNGIVALNKMEFPEERHADRKQTGAAAILKRVLELEKAPLATGRAMEDRMIGYCYHFATLHCAFLRAKGIPARARCGFASYFREAAWIDHWVVEYWNGDDWALIDPDAARDVVSRDEFRDGGRAWTLCRAGEADAKAHGNHVLWGWDELRGTLVNDLGALNKVEVGHWDWCGLLAFEKHEEPNEPLDARLDAVARAVSSAGPLVALRREFERNPDLQPPPELTSP